MWECLVIKIKECGTFPHASIGYFRECWLMKSRKMLHLPLYTHQLVIREYSMNKSRGVWYLPLYLNKLLWEVLADEGC